MGQDEQVLGDSAGDTALSADGVMPEDAAPERDPEPTSAPDITSVATANHLNDLNAEGIAETPSVDPGPFEIDVDYNDRVLYAFAHNRIPTVRSISIRNVGGAKPGTLTVSVTSKWGVSDRQAFKPSEFTVECPAPGQSVTIERPDCLLDDVTLGALEEAAPATLCISVRAAEGAASRIERPLEVMARTQWSRLGEDAAVTAAFVQPNHPSVVEILLEASKILEKRTGSGSLEGYQANSPDRVSAIASAIFSAMQSRVTTYINPPGGWEKEGQKLRPLDEVLETGMGTCIDLACAYASCLEQAGLHAIVFLVHGHAFPGFFLEDTAFDSQVESDLATVESWFESGRIIGVESTMIPSGAGGRRPFESAVSAVKSHFAAREIGCEFCDYYTEVGASPSDFPHFEHAVDIFRSRRAGVRPLPARVRQGDAIVIVIDNGPQAIPTIERRDAQTMRLLPNEVPARVQQWKNSLLDLSFRNPLLHFRPDTRGVRLFPAENSLGAIEDALISGEAISFVDATGLSDLLKKAGFTAIRNLGNNELSQAWDQDRKLYADCDGGSLKTRVKNLVSKAKLEEQDTGVNNLHLALGSLSWSDSKSEVGQVTSPIFLVPVRIQWSRGAQVPVMRLQEGGMTTVNYSLIEALRAKAGLKLEWFRQDMSDELGLDIARGLNELRKELLDMGLVRQGFEVKEDAGIGRLVFSKVRLWKDLDEHWAELSGNASVKHLVDGGDLRFVDPADPDAKGVGDYNDVTLISPQPADGAQTRAIVRALAGHTFVLEGPPGTGKSQTITNLLANALAAGKKVLFVAEKQAALGVVQERLGQVGLNPFCLELHDKGAKPEEVKAQLRAALDFMPSDVKDAWERNEATFSAAAEGLAEYRRRIHEPTAGGRSYFQAYRTLLELGEGETVPVGRAIVDESEVVLQAIAKALVEAPGALAPAQPRHRHPWSLAANQDRESLDRNSLSAEVEALTVGLSTVSATLGAWSAPIGSASKPEDLATVAAAARVAQEGRVPQHSSWREIASNGWLDSAMSACDDGLAGIASLKALSDSADATWLTTDWTTTRDEVVVAAASFVIGRKGRVKTSLGSLASTPTFLNLAPDVAVQRIQSIAHAAQTYRAAVATLTELPGIGAQLIEAAPSVGLVEQIRHRVADLAAISHAVTVEGPFGEAMLAALDSPTLPQAGTGEALDEVARALGRIGEIVSATEATIAAWLDGRPVATALDDHIGEWRAGAEGARFLELSRWCDAVAHLAPLDIPPTAELRTALLSGALRPDEAALAFERANLFALLEVLGEEYTLDVFDQHTQNRQVDRFIAGLSERQQLLRSLIPARLYEARTFSSTAGTGMVSEFRTELTSKRRGARSIRALIQKYPDIISALTPCFLMSPDSVAKFIVPGTIQFDMVVFDEASQIRVADAVGAMGRATSVVVVGDSKQMPPTSVGVAGGVDPEDEPVYGDNAPVTADAESILDEYTEAGFDSEMLSWHYRSKDELLIKFSNEHYYNGDLASFPAPAAMVGCGVEYRRVDGQFDHGQSRTNEIEADAIVAEIRRRAHDPVDSQYSIGVVTLNAEQQKLVRTKLEGLGDSVIDDLLDRDDEFELVVVNLESVQGRERDVIILGTSFSKRRSGEKMPLNFGPLTNAKGERRLNVAVTRARRLTMVISSFEPAELADAKSVGMVHLREYLELAKRATADRSAVIDAARPAEVNLYVQGVADALLAKGLRVHVGYGLSKFRVDLAVSTDEFPDRWLVGVLLDGEEWGKRALVLDRDALPVTVLKNAMGWPATVRVWLPAWRFRPEEVVADILDALMQAAEEVKNPPPMPEPKVVHVPLVVSGDQREVTKTNTGQIAGDTPPVLKSDRERPFVVAALPSIQGTSDHLDSGGSRPVAALSEIIERSGPIASTDALKLLANAFGLASVRKTRLEQLMRFIPDECSVSTPFGDFLFPRELLSVEGEVVDSFTWYRTSTLKQRTIQQISPHELANAMVDLVRDSFAIDPEDLARAMLTRFGYQRPGPEVLPHLLAVAEWAVDEGYFILSDGRYVIA